MRKAITAVIVLALLACVFIPAESFTEDNDTILLARTIYALGKTESYETKLALGSVVMNRLRDPWFSSDLGEVLRDQQQFPAGTRYDEDSLRAAHTVLSGKTTLAKDAVYYQAADASAPWSREYLAQSVGNYNFYYAMG